MIISFGQSVHERVEIEVLPYEREQNPEYWDEHWLAVDVRVRVGGFRAKLPATFVLNELSDVLTELRPLCGACKGSAEFKALDSQLKLHLACHHKGCIELHGEVHDPAEHGNRLHFLIHFDQSQLPRTIQELQKVLSECRKHETRKHRKVRPE